MNQEPFVSGIEMDGIYRRVPLERIPWNMEEPPDALAELVDSGKVLPGKAIDLGCGAGNYAIFLAGRGFTVTGVDGSRTAIKMARERARRSGVQCTFIVADVLGDLALAGDCYDFAFDWELLHHIFPEDRPRYVENVSRILRPGGLYLSVSFHEDDPAFGGVGKYRRTPLDTLLYFSSVGELRDLFSPRFTIIEQKTMTIRGKFGPHLANYVFMKKPV